MSICDNVNLWQCQSVTMSICDNVNLWQCQSVTMSICDNVNLWQCPCNKQISSLITIYLEERLKLSWFRPNESIYIMHIPNHPHNARSNINFNRFKLHKKYIDNSFSNVHIPSRLLTISWSRATVRIDSAALLSAC